jgi:hypothetical protein
MFLLAIWHKVNQAFRGTEEAKLTIRGQVLLSPDDADRRRLPCMYESNPMIRLYVMAE